MAVADQAFGSFGALEQYLAAWITIGKPCAKCSGADPIRARGETVPVFWRRHDGPARRRSGRRHRFGRLPCVRNGPAEAGVPKGIGTIFRGRFDRPTGGVAGSTRTWTSARYHSSESCSHCSGKWLTRSCAVTVGRGDQQATSIRDLREGLKNAGNPACLKFVLVIAQLKRSSFLAPFS